jgi:nicotinate phosphoribosyltransferase
MPIINSLLDLDFYKLTMGHLVWKKYKDVPVKYGFTNRTKKVKLGTVIPEKELIKELNLARTLSLKPIEYQYLKGLQNNGKQLFCDEYLAWLLDYKLPEYKLEYTEDGQIKFEVEGPWGTTIYWETIALSIINEMYYNVICSEKNFARHYAIEGGESRLFGKICALQKIPDIRFADFGTRRRFSQEWQEHVISRLIYSVPSQLIGTSNVDLARRYKLTPIGTMAHEMFMVGSRLLRYMLGKCSGQYINDYILDDWWEEYGYGLSIALTDTYGSDFFFKETTGECAANWKGLRQDSGDPFEFTEKAIDFYNKHNVNPKTKTIVYSDGLDVGKIIELHKTFSNRINVSFGWGTNFTNDVGLDPLSLVIKVTEVMGEGAVKLSDNLAKAIGKPEDIEEFKLIFGYKGNNYEEVKY